jgi:hypothetical protein
MSITEFVMPSHDEDWPEWLIFDDTRCSVCDEIVGGHFVEHPDTSADVPRWSSLWRSSDGQLFCEDCAHEEAAV